MKRKVFGAVLSIILASLVFLNGINLPVYAQEPPDMVHSISNGFVRFSVLAQNGRFSIKTSAGAANRDDSNQKLLYEDKKPETSFTSFWIDGKEYIYGNSYGFMGLDGTFTAPATVGKTNTSVWKIGAVEVTQSLVLLEDKDNPNVGNVRITYQVKNLSEKGDVKVGTRILLDTMLGSNDGAPIFIPGTQQPVETEIELKDDNIPQYWRGADNSFAPKVVSYGFTEGWGNLSPDKMVIGHWSGLSQSKWQYTPDDSLAFSGTDNPYGTADSAVALYWNPVSIGAGQTQVFETYYGIGNFSNINDRAKYGLTVNAPEKLVINDNKTGYLEDTFTITAELDNSLAGASNLTNVTASLILGDGLVLVPDEAQVPYATQQVIYKNTVQTFTWKVKAEKSEAYTTRRYRVDINCDNHTDPFSKDGYILLPGILGEPPQTQFLGVSPSKLYMDGAKSFTIKGKGFDIYMNKALWRMELVDSKGNIALQIPRAAINVGLEAITVNFDANLPRGSYSIRLKHDEPSVADETLKTKLEMTADKKFMSKTYGVLFVRKTETDGDYTYTLEIAQDEKELTQIEESLFSNEEIILDIKGVIRETEEQGSKVYRVFEKALLNSVLQYEGEPLVIQKVDDNQDVDGEDTIQISGDGTLTMENGFSFWFCEFESSIADGENYMTELADEDDGECNIELEFTGIGKVAKWIAGFAIQIENAVLLKRGISLGGGINITLPNMNKEHEVDDDEDEFPGISAEISNVLYGMKGESNDFGFIGIDFTTSLKAPEDMIPITWIQKGFEMTLTINTIDDLFSFEGEADIKICEANVNLTFIKNQASGWWLPDDFVIAAGFDPGFPLGPTGIFLNKVGGGVEDLFGTITGDGSLPPLQVILIAGLNFAEVIEVEAKLSISKNGFVFEGEGEIAKMKALKEVRVALTWAKPRSFELEAKLSLLKIIEGGISISVSADSWEGVVFADLIIPHGVPVVGGKKLFGTSLGASNKKIWGPVPVMNIPVMVTYYWGKNFEFKVPRPWGSAGEGFALTGEPGLYTTTVCDDEGDGVTMVVGGNIRLVGSSQKSETVYASTGSTPLPALPVNRIVAALDKQEHIMDIMDQQMALMAFKFSGDTPSLQVFRPDGSQYPLIDADQYPEDPNANMLVQVIEPEYSNTGEREQYIYITIVNPENGQWKVVSDQPVQSALMDVDPVPVFNSVTAEETADNQFLVKWDADHADGTVVNLYLAKDKTSSGVVLANGLNSSLGEYTVSVPKGTEEGDYYIRAVLDKGDAGYDTRYTESAVSVTDPYKPAAVTGVTLQPCGDGLLKAKWEKVAEDNISSYIVTVLDGNGEVVQSVGHVIADAEDDSLILGGQYTMQGTEQIGGLVPGTEYRVGIVASREIGDDESFTTHYSDMVYSNTVLLPEPKPASINIQYDSSFIDGFNDEGEKTKISNRGAVTLSFGADQSDISTDVFVNGSFCQRVEGKEFDVVLETEDGNYNVRFITINGNKDTTSQTVLFTVDKTAPMLMIDSPVQGQMSENGSILVRGITEKGTVISINGAGLVPDQNGVFEQTISIGDALKAEIEVEVSDRAGNVTQYNTEVLNDTIKNIDRISIRPVERELILGSLQADMVIPMMYGSDVEKEMVVGDSQAFSAVMIDDEGREIVLDTDVRWSLLMGASLAEVSEDGILRTFSHGDIVLKAAYFISEDYAFEDAIAITVLPDPSLLPVDEEDPYAGGEDPGTGEEEPGTGVEEPDIGEEEPGTGGEEPGTGEEDPGTGEEDPGTGEEEPGTGGEDPGTGGEEPGTSEEDPGTGGEDPGTGGEDPGTGGEAPGTGGQDPGTEEEEPGTGGEAPGTGGQDPGTEEEEPGTSGEAPGTGDEDSDDSSKSGSNGGSNSGDSSEIDRQLEEILNNIIQNEQNVTPMQIVTLYPNQSQTITLQNSGRLDIPSGIIGQQDKLFIGIVKDTSVYLGDSDLNTRLLSPIYEIRLAMSEHTLGEPVQLTFSLRGVDIQGAASLGVYYYNEAFGKWQYIGGVLNPETEEFTVSLNHFSKYALLANHEMQRFDDVDGRWSENYIKALHSLGIVNGIPYGAGYRFDPEREISRIEFTKMVVEALLQTNQIEDIQQDMPLPFTDSSQIPEWGRKYASLACSNNIISGRGTKGGPAFDAYAPITKAEAAVILGRTLDDPEKTAESNFIDKNRFPSWARDSIELLWRKGIVQGDSNHLFVPDKNLTREEAASMIMKWINSSY